MSTIQEPVVEAPAPLDENETMFYATRGDIAAGIGVICGISPKVAPAKVPTGWPPEEEPATVVTGDGLRAVGQRQYPLGGTPMNETKAIQVESEWGAGWKCCVCGTCNPADDCIPGAYL